MSPMLPPLADLALARTMLDRAAHRRDDPGLLPALLADETTATLVVAGSSALVRDADRTRLALLPPAAALEAAASACGGAAPVPVFVGEDPAGRAHVALLATLEGASQAAAAPIPAPPGFAWAGLRMLGTALDDVGVAALTAAVALAAWHASSGFCAACGGPTTISAAGWGRACGACGRQHFPRTDPAVIMAVQDDDGRLLLGRQPSWPPGRFSTLAGFVEAGESLEAAVRREVLEEAGVVVGDVAYQGSQPWPFPCSLMLGFSARARTTTVVVDGVELEDARWWSREGLAADVASGAVSLPSALSIARRLIEQWYGAVIEVADEEWR